MEERLRELELKFASLRATIEISIKWVGILGLVILAWLGINTFFQIPNSIQNALNDDVVSTTAQELETILATANEKAKMIAELSEDGKTITIDGQCFKPRKLVRCWLPKVPNHMTWVDNAADCKAASYENIEERIFLAQC